MNRGRYDPSPKFFGAGKESRTLDLNLGKVALYQLSYSRMVAIIAQNHLRSNFGPSGFGSFVPDFRPKYSVSYYYPT